jgi:hypothetical protein
MIFADRLISCFSPGRLPMGALTDGFDSTVNSMRILFPGARLGFCLRHALNKLPDKLVGVPASVRTAPCR